LGTNYEFYIESTILKPSKQKVSCSLTPLYALKVPIMYKELWLASVAVWVYNSIQYTIQIIQCNAM